MSALVEGLCARIYLGVLRLDYCHTAAGLNCFEEISHHGIFVLIAGRDGTGCRYALVDCVEGVFSSPVFFLICLLLGSIDQNGLRGLECTTSLFMGIASCMQKRIRRYVYSGI